MNVADLIAQKRDGQTLDEKDINQLIDGFTAGDVPDYQMSAFAMAVFFQGMTPGETTCLTKAMIDSGQTLKWSGGKPAVDKHSTGGIGDKISIPLAPLLACCDVEVPMISGRGLGATGGTLDKLEAIPGYRTGLSVDEFASVINWNGCSIASASEKIAPADRKLYALRDVTGTVPSIPLITASILSKKIAEGIDALILDVKWGSGAFMQTLDQARALAQSLVEVGNQLGAKTKAIITDMNQPLGRMIGNAVEIDESVDVLKGEGPDDVVQLTLALGAELLVLGGAQSNFDSAKAALQDKIDSGDGLKRLKEMVKSHGGDLDAPRKRELESDVKADRSGYVSKINTQRIGLAVIEMGGGRKMMGDPINHASGVEFLIRIGDKIEAGQTIAKLFCESSAKEYARTLISASVSISDSPTEAQKLIVETVG
jgi:pyrimidine-nucleoside phosphorylase